MNNIVLDRQLYGHNHIKGCWEHHLEWCPKYRYNALRKQSIKEDCEKILETVCKEQDWELLELAVMPDHVHAIVRTHKPVPISEVLFKLKGRSAYELFRKHPNLRLRYPRGAFWSRGNLATTVGANIETVRKYVRNQRNIHQKQLAEWAT